MAPVAGLCALLAACASQPARVAPTEATAVDRIHTSTHRDADDLLTAGLEAAGLRNPVAPAFADPERPTTAELRRRAIWANWRGIADLAPGGGYGEFYGALAPVPGREFHALRTVPAAHHPHRVMVQVPDAFDAKARCVVVTAASGSRGIMAPSRSPGPGVCRAAARWPTPTKAPAPIISTSIAAAAWHSMARARKGRSWHSHRPLPIQEGRAC